MNSAADPELGLIQSLKLQSLKQHTFSQNSSLLASGLFYQLNKEDELEKIMYQDDFNDLEEDDEFYPEEESNRDNYDEDFEFDYHRYK
ncbi:hypothetical protein [Adhaeribacter radiodurans]|uniref:Uncharacterized protein n=1 Tax=Adhaeribacter radiodurans TaxID=2745197 RepID=A0A7L7LE42_9BACT|nr:hypothetical protein [Adhaeribacter radiodurans]QMU31116.1 hypothetical protein HUW48_25200 [Adhaeribacter radiodurans]